MKAGRPSGRPTNDGKKLDAHRDVQHLNEKGEVSPWKKRSRTSALRKKPRPPLKRYCRKAYELGYIPHMSQTQRQAVSRLEIPDEKRNFYSIPQSWDGAECCWCAEMKSARL